MISEIKENLIYKKRLKELKNKYHNCLDSYSASIENTKKHNPQDLIRLFGERQADCLEYEFQLKKHISNHLLSRAQKLYVQKPDINDVQMWEEQFRDECLILSEKGLAEIDSAILKKRKERMQVWLPLISALTGLIAALIGFFALFK